MAARTPKPKRRRERGDDGISWDKVNKCYVGTISLGYDDAGKRLRRSVRGKTKQEVKDKLDELHEEIKAGIRTPATYTVRQCVTGLARLARARSAHHGHLSRPGREVDLSEDRREEADGLQGHRRRPVLQGRRQGTQQVVAGEDQEHARQVDPPGAEVRPHRQERRRARRPAAGTARAPVAGHDRGAGQQGAPGRQRPADRLRQGREGRARASTRRPTPPPRPASWRAAPGRAWALPSPRSAPI